MDAEVLAEYKRIRKDHVSRYRGTGHIYHHKVKASFALRAAKQQVNTKRRWQEAKDKGLVRFEVVPDEIWDFEDLAGDCFNPEVNDNIQPHILEREEQAFKDRIYCDGVWGIRSLYFNGEEWIHADSVYGFVGDDWQGSGYDLDVMDSALDQLAELELCECCGRPKIK